jgi:hypothetical protein
MCHHTLLGNRFDVPGRQPQERKKALQAFEALWI